MAEAPLPDASILTGWRKSSYSAPDAGSCLEVIDGHPTRVPVRDSKDPHGPAVLFSHSSWASFVAALSGSAVGR